METPTENESIILCTYRFNLSKDLIDELTYFSQMHRFDDRKTFKESWIKWKENEENRILLDLETNRLIREGYDGNIEDKIFKSIRYYIKKKIENDINKTAPKKRKQYELLSEKFLETIDEHIYRQLHQNIISKTKTEEKEILISNVSQSDAYYDFCVNNKKLIEEEINLLFKKNSDKTYSAKELSNKFKKTYKNRFFNIKINMNK